MLRTQWLKSASNLPVVTDFSIHSDHRFMITSDHISDVAPSVRELCVTSVVKQTSPQDGAYYIYFLFLMKNVTNVF